MYASDNGGHYPESLDRLVVGKYLKVLPTCPSVGKVTFTNYQVGVRPDRYSFGCVGKNHAPAYVGFDRDSSNYPQYSSDQGLLDHP